MDAGNFLSGSARGESSGFLICQLLDLLESLFEEKLRRDALVVDADRHVGRDLVEGLGNRVQAGDPVVVVLDRGEAELSHELRIDRIDAAHLVNGHLPRFELGGLLVVGEAADEEFAADLVLVREPGGIDGSELQQEFLLSRKPFVDRLYGVVRDLVVVSLVADVGGELGLPLKIFFPIIVEEGM